MLSFRYGTKLVPYLLTTAVVPSDFERAVQLVSTLRTNSTSKQGLKYRSLICTIVRNDPYLMEFLVRSLITGFSHIVVYDNNRIYAGYDTNISSMLAPFIAAQLVTHVSWDQNNTDLLTNDDKVVGALQCINTYEKFADWIAYFDTDEYLYYEKEQTAVDMLDDLLLELERKNACAAAVPMTLMYGEARMLKQNRTLFEAYPRVCKVRPLPKILARPRLTNYFIPHNAACKSAGYKVHPLNLLKSPKTALIHYYSKSMQEYLEKADKSMPPYIRKPISTYITGPVCHLVAFPYLRDYQRRFLNMYQRLAELTVLSPVRLSPTPRLNAKLMSTKENDLYNQLRYRCEQGQEFDNEKYIAMHPMVNKSIQTGKLVDGLYHFMANFPNGASGCWKTQTNSFCEH